MNSKAYFRKNFSLAWPLAVNVLLVQSMLMIDTVMVAPLGEMSVAAMGIATAILMFALGVELAIGNGIQLFVGRAQGSKSQSGVVVAFWVGLFVNFSVALLFFGALVIYGPELAAVLTDDAAIEENVLFYFGITKYIILLTAFTQVCTAFYNGRGNTKITLKGFLIEIPVNVVLSYVLIYGVGEHSGLGLKGAAWGSLVAVFLRTVFFVFVLKFDKDIDLRCPKMRPFFTEVRLQTLEIFPIAANFFVLFIGASVYQLLFAQLDLSSFVAVTLIFPWLRIGTQFVSAWAQASAINISQALGRTVGQALSQEEARHFNVFVSACTRTALALSLAVGVLFFLLSQFIHLIYPDVDSQTYLALGIIAPLYIFLPIIRGYNSVSGNILRSFGESNRVLKLHLVTQWMISLPVCALLILYFDVTLFWAFAMLPVEELLKTYPFYRYTRSKLKALA